MTTSTFDKGGETIYRQDAIEAIKSLPRWVMDANGEFQPVDPPTVSMIDPEDAVSAIEKLPSAMDCQKCVFCGFAGFKQFQIVSPEIIRCKDCRYDSHCAIQTAARTGNTFFCGAAKRREE